MKNVQIKGHYQRVGVGQVLLMFPFIFPLKSEPLADTTVQAKRTHFEHKIPVIHVF